MAQKWVDLSGSSATDRQVGLLNASKHLSDGTLVFLDYDGTSLFLKYTSDHQTINTIATVAGFNAPTGSNRITLEVDGSDNLYVLGWNGAALRGQGFTKGAGYTWTAQTAITGSTSLSSALAGLTAAWCNTGQGTNNKGHLVVLASNGVSTWVIICDAGVLLAGAGTLQISSTLDPTFLSTQSGGAAILEIAPDGFGALSGLAINQVSATLMRVGSWAISTAGALTTNTSVGTVTTLSSGQRARLIRASANLWAVVYCSTTSTHYAVGRYSATAQLTAGTDSGAATNMPLNAGALSSNLDWDAFLDPVTANKVWVIASAAASAGSSATWRQGCAVGTAVTWDAAATADDTLTNANATPVSLRAVVQPRSPSTVDWQAFLQTAATPTYALDGNYTVFASAPNAPTPTAPASGAFIDATAGVTFTDTYNSTDGANQSAYALRIKSGGAYSYWNVSTASWQGTIVWNPISTAPGASWSVGPITAGIANGSTFNWAAASQEALASLQGPFATDSTFTAQAAPTVTVTAPTGSVTNTNEPTATWTTTAAAGLAQTAYRVVVEHGAYGTTPGSGTQDYDSGTLSGSAQALQIPVALANGQTYRVFVQATETNGVVSAWAFSTFTESLDVPATPSITAAADTDPATGAPRVKLTVQAQDNVLSAVQASLEDGTTTGWAAGASTGIANTTAQALDGTHSLQLTRLSTTGAASATTPTGVSGAAVTPNQPWQCLANFRAAATPRTCTVQVLWFQASGAASAVRASDTSAGVVDSTTGWVQASLAVTSPSDAAFAAVVPSVAGAVANEVHYVDNIDLGPGTSLVWTRGGLVGSTTVVVTRSDGVVVRSTVGGTAIAGPAQQVVAYDLEATLNQAYTYTAVVSAVLAGPATIASAASAPSGPATLTSRQSWVVVPGQPALTLGVGIVKYATVTRPVAQGVTPGIGNPTEWVSSDVWRGRHGTITVRCPTEAVRAALVNQLDNGTTLLLLRPPNDPASPALALWFVVQGAISEDNPVRVHGTPERQVTFGFVEQARP